MGTLHASAAKKGTGKPNILFITTDQQFADVMSCAGSKWVKTPAMDSIARKGVRFPNAYVNYPVCMPERYTMYTGRLPCQRYFADENNKPTISLGNQARVAGYDTAYFGKWHVQDETFSSKDHANHGFDLHTGGKDKSMTANAIEFFSGKRDKPFLAVVSYYNPHDICEWGRKKAGRTEGINMRNGDVDVDPPLADCPPLPENYAINPDESEAVEIRRGLSSKGVPNAQLMAMDFSEDEWRQYRWAYNRLVEMVDGHIGELLQSLEDNGLAKNTIVIFTSDHGDGYGAHRWHQKSVLYEESCRVPFIISYPGKGRENETDDRLISVGIDLMATISDIVGTDMPQGPYFGLSALPFVLDKNSRAPSHDYVVSEAEVRITKNNEIAGRGLRTPKYKYHLWSKGDNREQLFDMINDPGETRNLAENPEYAEQLKHHRALFADWLKKTDDTYSES
ncbi:sulfatase-like hydrolase/transferase [Pontiellaceae bacterium B12219]|nr:sulfatase-like hydrolase/transferase [Pontiellaceae bacterium B12219]